MRPFLVLQFLLASTLCVFGQAPKMRLGFTAGPTVAWASGESQLSSRFFIVSRAGFQGGITNSIELGEHFFASASASYSIQSFALRQTSAPAVGVDARFRSHNLEFPIMLGFSGYLGSLRHREFIGAGLQLNLNYAQNVKLSGDSSSTLNYSTTASQNKSAYPVLIAGFEVGSIFKNDAALYFGATLRYGLQDAYSGSFNAARFSNQVATYSGTYLGIGITYYLPRYSYWFKREFIY